MPAQSGTEHERLSVLVGRWKTDGRTRPRPDAPSITVDAIDTYEWLPGRRDAVTISDEDGGNEVPN